MGYAIPNDIDRIVRAAACSSAFSALLWYGPISISDIRWINLKTLAPWSVGLLICIMDCGINLDGRMDAMVHGNIVEENGVIADRIRVIHGGRLIGELIEADADGDFRCLKRLRNPDA